MYNTAYHASSIQQHSFLITGGAGFIGSNIVEYLLKFGAGKVRVLDNLATGFLENIEPFMQNPAFELMEGDISDSGICLKACEGIDYVSHQAALGSVPRSVKDPQATNNSNVTGFINMLVAAKSASVKRLVYASSSSVYGDSPTLPKTEDIIGEPLSPYAVSKRINELYAGVFAKTYQMELAGLRYFNIFGPRQSPNGPYAACIPVFMSAVLKNESPWINGDGEQSRDFTFVENAVQANIRAMFCDLGENNGGVFNVAVGERTSINHLFDEICKTAGSELEAKYRQEREGDVKHSLANIEKAGSVMGYNPLIDINKGLEITFNWFKKRYFPDLN